MNNGYFPIGTLVVLKNATKPVMIMACPSFEDKKKYDYLGVMFPIGFFDKRAVVNFNKDQIKSVQFIGFEDEMSKKYLDSLKSGDLNE